MENVQWHILGVTLCPRFKIKSEICGAKTRANNKLSPHMIASPEFKLLLQWHESQVCSKQSMDC